MNINLKLILLGLLAMFLTFLAFTAIEAAIVRPLAVSAVVGEATQAANPTGPVLTSSPAVRTEIPPPTPSLLLTLPGDPFSSTVTPTSTVGLTETPETSPDPFLKGTSDASQLTPTSGSFQPTVVAPANPTISSGTAGIQGRVLFNGALFSGTVVLRLVDPVFNEDQQFTFMDGEYILQDLQPSQKGYQVVFSRDDNLQLSQNQVVSEVMVGPLPAGDGDLVRYPDFDIALLGLEPLEPEPDTIFTDHPITPQQPMRFVWNGYPSLSQYRLELKPGRLSPPVWTSGFLSSDSVVFDGVLTNGALIERGTYWWSVSARSANGAITVVGPTAELILNW